MDYKRKVGESEEVYIYRICNLKDSIGTWKDVADILNKNLDTDYGESKFRKDYQVYSKMERAIIEEHKDKMTALELKHRDIELSRKKLQTQKLEYNQWLREQARDELFIEQVTDAIESNVSIKNPIKEVKVKHGKYGYVLNIADMHFGKEFKVYGLNNEVINEYSPEIFYERMDKLLSETIAQINKEQIYFLKVFNLGDALDGFIRNSQIWTLRYNVVDSAIKFGNYMANWLRELSKYVKVEYHQTTGNHGEMRLLDGKKNQHAHENIEKITGEFIRALNKDNPNFKYLENKSGLIFSNVIGFNVLGIHGEVKNLEQSLKDYTNLYNINIDYVIAGHKHHEYYMNCGVRKGVIGVSSIVGIDDFSITLRKAADASASLVAFEQDKGRVDEHTFVLN